MDLHRSPAPRSATHGPSSSAYARLLDGYEGFDIDEPSERGITLAQLRHTFDCALERCALERWTSTNPLNMGQPLVRETITLYDLVGNFIVPATGGGRRALVELLASESQPPAWFVSHCWAEPVYLFIRCLEQHATDHMLGDDSPYWVCAYANRQSQAELALELPADALLSETPFFKAIKLSDGVVSIVDPESKAFTRAWCAFELWTALEGNVRHDIYTTLGGGGEEGADGVEAVGLVDGYAEIDLSYALGKMEDAGYYKSYREKEFPIERAHRVLLITVADAEASVEADRLRIMASITEPSELDATLRARFGAAVIERVLGSDEPDAEGVLRRYGEAFARSRRLRRVMAQMHSEPAEVRCALLSQSLPLGLAELTLARVYGPAFVPRAREMLLSNGAALETLELVGCRVDDASARLLGSSLRANSSLRRLDLRVNQIGDAGAEALGDGLGCHPALQLLNLGDNRIRVVGARALALGLASSPSLAELHLSGNSVGERGGHAVSNALALNCSLTALYFSNSKLCYSGAARLGKGLGENTSLQQLRVNNNEIGDRGARALCTGLRTNAALTELHAQDNEICNGGACALGMVLATSASLRVLVLSFNRIGDAGMVALCNGVTASATIADLALCHNAFGDVGAAAAGDSLRSHVSLTFLDCRQNSIGDSGALALANGLAHNSVLTKLNLHSNSIGELGTAALSAAVQARVAAGAGAVDVPAFTLDIDEQCPPASTRSAWPCAARGLCY